MRVDEKIDGGQPPVSSDRMKLALRRNATVPGISNVISDGSSRGAPARGSANHRVEQAGRALVSLIARWAAADELERRTLQIRIRSKQDAIGFMRQRNSSNFLSSPELAWAEAWTPTSSREE